MLDFLQQIDNQSKDHIHSISFWVDYSRRPPDTDQIYETGSQPQNWAKALDSAEFKNITRTHVQGESVNDFGSVWMDPDTENAIKNILQRNPRNKSTRKLELKGYGSDVCKQFPKSWEITMKQWEQPDKEK